MMLNLFLAHILVTSGEGYVGNVNLNAGRGRGRRETPGDPPHQNEKRNGNLSLVE